MTGRSERLRRMVVGMHPVRDRRHRNEEIVFRSAALFFMYNSKEPRR